MISTEHVDLVECRICRKRFACLPSHLSRDHNIEVVDYIAKFPDEEIFTRELWEAVPSPSSLERRHPDVGELFTEFAGIKVKVNSDVPLDECLYMPPNYMAPTFGVAARKVTMAALSLANKRSVYVWGPPGSGKDALIHAFSSLTRTPGEVFSVKPGANLERWFFVRSFDSEGTKWEEGRMLKLLRDGYLTESGERKPCIILITDFDRATPDQAEVIRLNLDTIKKRVKGPMGDTFDVLPGTIFAFTANSSGSGDYRRRCVSSNPLDASLMDRIDRKYNLPWMDWRDESKILKEKFPYAVKRVPGLLRSIGAATTAIRHEILENDAFFEFTHRTLCHWISQVEDLLRVNSESIKDNLLGIAAECWLDGLPDDSTRDTVIGLIDPHIKGGATRSFWEANSTGYFHA